jgi:hypothetical protein
VRKIEFVLILSLCVVLAGCGTAFNVTHGGEGCKEGKCNGIPFYTKVAACKHETVWLEQTYILTLVGIQEPEGKRQPDKQQIVLFKLTKEISQYRLITDFKHKFQQLIKSVIGHDPNNARSLYAILCKFNELPEYTLPKDSAKLLTDQLVLASNRNETYDFVDYTDPYYFNAKAPFSGSVNAEIDLGPNLTLSKASGNIQEDTFKTFMSVLSTAMTAAGGVITSLVAPPPPTTTTRSEKPPKPVVIELTIDPQVYQYAFSKVLLDSKTGKPAKPPCQYMEPISKFADATTFSRNMMPVDESTKKGDVSNKVKFSGSVDLPKPSPQTKRPEEPKPAVK